MEKTSLSPEIWLTGLKGRTGKGEGGAQQVEKKNTIR